MTKSTIISGLLLAVMLLTSAVFQRTLAQTPFTCSDGVSYRLQGNPSELYTVNLRTGVATLLFNAAALGNRNLQALGYNPQDNFLYASVNNTNDILKIGASGAPTLIDVPGLPAAAYEAGDVAPDGTYYLYVPSATTFRKVNLSTLAVSSITVDFGASLPDFAISPDGSVLYGVSTTGSLIRYPTAGGNQAVVSFGLAATTTAAFADKTGDLFVTTNGSSTVYEISGASFANANSGSQIAVQTTSITNTDGARCVNSSAIAAPPTFPCSPDKAFLSTSTQNLGSTCVITQGNSTLIELDLSTGATIATSGQLIRDWPGTTSDATAERTSINNMGFNPKDNYLWAYRFGTNQLIRIGSDRTVDYFAINGLSNSCTNSTTPTNNNVFYAGDINSAGVMYLLNGDAGDRLIRVDLDPASPTYLTKLSDVVLSRSPSAGTLNSVADMAFNPIDNQLYLVTAQNELVRIDPTTGTVTTVGTVTGAGSTGTNYVAAYFDNTGAIYFRQGTTSGIIYRITNVAGGNTAAINFSTVTGSTTAGDGARCANSSINPPLPVTLTEWRGQWADGQGAILSWTTTDERDNDHFQIQRSSDARSFETIGRVKGAGTITTAQNYQFVDSEAPAEVNYYRLRQVDKDGTFADSKIIALRRGVETFRLSITPNPASDQLEVKVQGTAIMGLRLRDVQGRLLRDAGVKSQMEVSQLAPGLYVIEVITESGQVLRERFIKQ